MSKKRPCRKARYKAMRAAMKRAATLENNLSKELGDTPRVTETRSATQKTNRGLSLGVQQAPYYHQLTLVKKD